MLCLDSFQSAYGTDIPYESLICDDWQLLSIFANLAIYRRLSILFCFLIALTCFFVFQQDSISFCNSSRRASASLNNCSTFICSSSSFSIKVLFYSFRVPFSSNMASMSESVFNVYLPSFCAYFKSSPCKCWMMSASMLSALNVFASDQPDSYSCRMNFA